MAHFKADVDRGREVTGCVPPDWNREPLAGFLDQASNNLLGTFVQLRDRYDTVLRVDSAYRTFTENLLNPSDAAAPLLLLQAHAAYRAAVGLGMSCQEASAFMVMRGCLESSLYGLYFNQHPESFELWARRHQSDGDRARVKSTFTIANLKKCLADLDPTMAEILSRMYDKTIDLGAHPNVAALAGAVRSTRTTNGLTMELIYLKADAASIGGTMNSIAQTGVCSLFIFRNAFKERFDLLGITDTLNALRQEL